jgi:alpha-amylase
VQWDLGEFTRRGTKPTRWGTKEELVEAIRVAKEHGIDVLIDAVTNVRCSYVASEGRSSQDLQHKMGADGKEEVRAVEVDPQNRNRVIGPLKAIEVSYPIFGVR